jgi:DNA-binding GntR family transcriptional regulator
MVPPSLSDQLVSTIRERILCGEILPGVHLVEQELAADFGVGRLTVREALRRLLADDVVELLPHKGIRVRRLSPADLAELYVVREPVECLAARLAASAPPRALQPLREIHREAAKAAAAGDWLAYMRLNARFHHGLAEATGNRTLVRLVQRLNAQLIGYQFLAAIGTAELTTSQRDHEDLLAALGTADPGRAESIMRRHLRASRRAILGPVVAAFGNHQKHPLNRSTRRAERLEKAAR